MRALMLWRADVRCGLGPVAEGGADLARILAAARALAPEGIAIAARDPTKPSPPLWQGEVLAKAIPRRQTEFAAGRACVRDAMAQLGLAPSAVPHGPDRAPVWPQGLHGSITHSARACLAAITLAPRLIGIDLEPAIPLEEALWDAVLLPQERRAVMTAQDPGLQAKLIFSAKEAAYKAQYLRSHTLLDYHAMDITVTPQGFTARFTQTVPGFAQNTLLKGQHGLTEGQFITLVTA